MLCILQPNMIILTLCLSWLQIIILGVASLKTPPFVVQDGLRISTEVKVPVQLGVMSRCPDALVCENTFNQVLSKVAQKVDLSLTYIAKIDPSEPDFGVNCMHGPEECAGNVQQLCAVKYANYPAWWEFVQCQNYHGRYKIGLPSIALECANVVGIDWESEIGNCAGLDGSGKGLEGIRLLQESVIQSKNIGIKKSCSILINEKLVCVHDGTWKECEIGHTVDDFVRQINEEYEQLNNM